jgi:hypothetical protein
MYATGTAKEVAMVSDGQGRYATRYWVLGGSGGGHAGKWRDDLVVEVVTLCKSIYDESLTVLYLQNGARIRYIRRSSHRDRSSAEYSCGVSQLDHFEATN